MPPCLLQHYPVHRPCQTYKIPVAFLGGPTMLHTTASMCLSSLLSASSTACSSGSLLGLHAPTPTSRCFCPRHCTTLYGCSIRTSNRAARCLLLLVAYFGVKSFDLLVAWSFCPSVMHQVWTCHFGCISQSLPTWPDFPPKHPSSTGSLKNPLGLDVVSQDPSDSSLRQPRQSRGCKRMSPIMLVNFSFGAP